MGLVERLAAQGALDAADFLAAGAPSDTRPALVPAPRSLPPLFLALLCVGVLWFS